MSGFSAAGLLPHGGQTYMSAPTSCALAHSTARQRLGGTGADERSSESGCECAHGVFENAYGDLEAAFFFEQPGAPGVDVVLPDFERELPQP